MLSHQETFRISMSESVPALTSSVIWAFCPIYYRDYFLRYDTPTINLLRLCYGGLAMLVPFLLLGSIQGLPYAMVSGVVVLVAGDTFYFYAVKYAGASVAAPVAYTDVLLTQFSATLVGEPLRPTFLVSSCLIIAGIYTLSRGDRTGLRLKGVSMALGASVLWTAGQTVLQVATSGGANPLSLTFMRIGGAVIALGIVFVMRRPKGSVRFGARRHAWLAALSVADTAVGTSFFVYSLTLVGLNVTILLTSLSPFLTQVFSKALGKEKPKANDLLAGALIVVALVLTVV
jgi:DME family drug/metabolite transporter